MTVTLPGAFNHAVSASIQNILIVIFIVMCIISDTLTPTVAPKLVRVCVFMVPNSINL